MKNIVGTPALGENFFKRDREIEKIYSRLKDGNNLQIVAPRRVGKTSILHYLKDTATGGYIYIYVDTESVNSEQDFYKKILKAIVKVDAIANSNQLQALLQQGLNFFKKIKSVKVMGNGIDFNEETERPDYYEEITNFLSGIRQAEEQKIIILIDEFPQTILNIAGTNNGDTKAAIQFLQSNRELRLNPNIMGNIQFVYTGSIGLNHTVAAINGTAFVNDLNSTEVEPLLPGEAQELVCNLLNEKGINAETSTIAYLLEKIGWLIPFHIQLAIQEISGLCRQNKKVTISIIDEAFELMIALRNNNHFEHYYSRLKSQFKGSAFDFAEALLQLIANKGIATKGELYDLSVADGVNEQFRQIIEVLMYDGYINNNSNSHSYQFNSPLVRLWWKKFVCK